METDKQVRFVALRRWLRKLLPEASPVHVEPYPYRPCDRVSLAEGMARVVSSLIVTAAVGTLVIVGLGFLQRLVESLVTRQ